MGFPGLSGGGGALGIFPLMEASGAAPTDGSRCLGDLGLPGPPKSPTERLLDPVFFHLGATVLDTFENQEQVLLRVDLYIFFSLGQSIEPGALGPKHNNTSLERDPEFPLHWHVDHLSFAR